MIAPMPRPMFIACLLATACALASASLVIAQPGATVSAVSATRAGAVTQGTSYTINHYSIDNGGGRSSGGAFAITGSIGQHDADPLQPSTGGAFAVTGGFWPGTGAPLPTTIFSNGFEGP